MKNIALVAALLISIFSSKFDALAKPSQPEKPRVAVREIQLQTLFDRLSYPARVDSNRKSVLLAENEGVVSSLLTPLGSSVKKGQEILTLKHTDPIYQYAPVRVRSPITGVVSEILVSPGSQVTKGQRLVCVIDPNDLKIQVEIASMDLLSIESGKKGDLTLAGTQKTYEVEVRGVSPLVDSASGTASAELRFLTNSKGVRPGMVGTTVFRVNEREGIRIPAHAVVYRGKKTMVRLLENQRAKYAEVRLGERQEGQIEILEGLPSTGLLIERSSQYLAEGEEVEIEKE